MSQSSQCTPKKRSSPSCTPVKFSSVQSSPLVTTSTEPSPKKKRWDIPDLQVNMQHFHATFETQCKAILYDLSCGGVADATQEMKKLLQQSKSFMAEATPALSDFNLKYKALTQKADFIQKYNTNLQKENAKLKQEIQNTKDVKAMFDDDFEDSGSEQKIGEGKTKAIKAMFDDDFDDSGSEQKIGEGKTIVQEEQQSN